MRCEIHARSRVVATALVLLLAVASAVPASAAWFGVDGAPVAAPTVEVVNLDPGRSRVEVTLAGVEISPVVIDGRDHVRVTLPGHGPILDRGAPQVPFIAISLIVPAEGSSAIRILSAEYEEIAGRPVEPSKGSILRTVDPKTVPYTFGPAYRGGVFPAEVAELSRPYIVRDHRGVNLRIHPVQWDADRGVLRVLARLTLEVTTSGRGGVNPARRTTGAIPTVFAALYAQQFANLDAAVKDAGSTSEGRMLIVCHDPFVAAMQPFIAWKIERGIPTELITTSSVGGSIAGIQAAIDARYQEPEGLAYVILVGDGAEVPHYVRASDGANDDTRYVRLAGDDVYPDALISRISAQTPDQVATQVAKFVAYERDVAGVGDWAHRAVGIASDEDGDSGIYDYERMDQLRDRLLSYEFSDVDRIYQNLGGGTTDIAAAVDAGRSLINYMGHGSGLAWGSVYFNTTHVHELTNTAWPWVIDVSCFNGGISTLGESLAEAWLRAGSKGDPHGAVGMYSASGSIPWVEPTVMQHEAVAVLAAETSHVIGVIAHAGIMEVLDRYGEEGVGLLLVEHYNLFGDCSLMVRTASPNLMTVAHQPVVPILTPSMVVETGAPGVTVTVSSGGVIHGSAIANSQGRADVVFTNAIDAVGTVTLTVFGFNQQTYQASLPVLDPASVTVDPPAVVVGMTTEVTITATDPESGSGLEGVLVRLDGFGFTSADAPADTAGRITVDVTPAYGEVLQVRGRAAGESYDLFVVDLPVTGAVPLDDPVVTAAVPDIGLVGALTPGREGTVSAATAGSGFTLFIRGDGLDLSQTTVDNSLSLTVTPGELSPVIATIGRPGYELFQQDIAVITAMGTLAGTVVDTAGGGAPLTGAGVAGRPVGADPGDPPAFTAVTDSTGSFAPTDPMPVGDYVIEVTRFGYAVHQETVFLLHGANTRAFGLTAASTGAITGSVIATKDGAPLDGTVAIHRADTDELIVSVATDPVTGEYNAGPVPFFDYRVEARSFRHVPASVPLTVNAPAHTVDFSLEVAPGEMLVLADGDPEELVADLEALVYNVTVEMAAASDPAGWDVYDLVIYAAGDNAAPLVDADLRASLIAHEQAGGRLLLEGGDVAFTAMGDPGFPTLAADVLHVAGWHGDAGGELAVAAAGHPVMLAPNIVVGPIDIAFFDWSVADRVSVTADAELVGAWTNFTDQASVICHDDDPAMQGGQIVFFTFAYGSAGAGRRELLENAVVWLLGADPHPLAAQDTDLPAQVVLVGNHPNPFNPSTVIRFALPAAEDVDLAVFDLAGRRVRTLVQQTMPAGRHEIVWRGCDDADRPLASGVYVTRLAAGTERRVTKMTLLK